MKKRIFFSYHRVDSVLAERLMHEISAHSLFLWMDCHDVSKWEWEMEMSSAFAHLVLISKHSDYDEYISEISHHTKQKRDNIILILLDKQHIYPDFRDLPVYHLEDWDADKIENLSFHLSDMYYEDYQRRSITAYTEERLETGHHKTETRIINYEDEFHTLAQARNLWAMDYVRKIEEKPGSPYNKDNKKLRSAKDSKQYLIQRLSLVASLILCIGLLLLNWTKGEASLFLQGEGQTVFVNPYPTSIPDELSHERFITVGSYTHTSASILVSDNGRFNRVYNTPDKIAWDVTQTIREHGQAAVLITLAVDETETGFDTITIQTRQAELLEELARGNFVLAYQFQNIPSIAGLIYENDLEQLQNSSLVRFVSLDKDIETHIGTPSSVSIREILAFNSGFERGSTIAVFDTGIVNSEGLNSVIQFSYCAFSSSATRTEQCSTNINATNTISNIHNIVPNSGLINIQILNHEGKGLVSDFLAGLDWLINHHADYRIQIVSMNLGTTELYTGVCDTSYPQVADALSQLRKEGVLVIASTANNSMSDAIAAPACIEGVFSVAPSYEESNPDCSVDNPSSLACFSNRSMLLDFFVSVSPPENRANGSSMATAIAAGTVAMMLEANPQLTPGTIELILNETSNTFSIDEQSYELLNPNEAIAYAAEYRFECSEVIDVPVAECIALESFYNSTGGANWANNSGWLVDTSICNWYGVSCIDHHVQSIDLSANGLTGRLPEQLSDLLYLEQLFLGDNAITGEIPIELANLTQLQELDLSRNRLEGTLPSTFGQLRNLEYLNLSYNAISGRIPSSFASLDNLDISYNMISNDPNTAQTQILPPTSISLQNLTNTSVQLTWEAIDFGQDTDNISYEISLGTSHNNLELISRQNATNNSLVISGLLPDTNYIASVQLKLSYYGTTPVSNWQQNILISSSVIVSFTSTSFCDTITTELGRNDCAILENIYFAANGDNWLRNDGWLRNDDLCTWYGITCQNGHVIELNLSNNQLFGVIPERIGSLSHLERLNLSDNQLYGSIPNELEALTQLVLLDLSNNQLYGAVPNWTGLSRLRELNLSNNLLNSAIPDNLVALPALEVVLISHNQLIGLLPTNPYSSNLRRLDLSENQLNGTPFAAPFATGIIEIDLSNNQLSGSLPTNINQLNQLRVLDLSNNYMVGTIPSTLADLSNLQVLNLSSNQFFGELPGEFSNLLTHLNELNLSYNAFGGNLPNTCSLIPRLEAGEMIQININYNMFSGIDVNTDQCSVEDALLVLERSDIAMQLDWYLTQTVAPNNIVIDNTYSDSLTITWSPILYSSTQGYYEVWCGELSDQEAIEYVATIPGLLNVSYTLNDLASSEPYYCAVRSITLASGLQKNTLASPFSTFIYLR